MVSTWWIVLRAIASMFRCLWHRLFVMMKSLSIYFFCQTIWIMFFLLWFHDWFFSHFLLSSFTHVTLVCLFFTKSNAKFSCFWIVFFLLWFHEFFMFLFSFSPLYYYHSLKSLLDCLFFHQVQCLSLKCAIVYYCWLLGAVVVAWGVAGSVKMLISITLRPRSIGSVISSPLLVQTCLLRSVWLWNFYEGGSN